MTALSTAFIFTVLGMVPLVDSFVSNPLSFLALKQSLRQAPSQPSIAVPRVTIDMLSMTSQEAQSENPSETMHKAQCQVSLASDYRVDISSSQDTETWSLTPISDVVQQNDAMALAEGAQANRALQMKRLNDYSCTTLQCTLNRDNFVVTLDSPLTLMDTQLVATLSRIMVQSLASRQEEQSSVKEWTISLLDEVPMKLENVCSEVGVLKLFDPITNTANVELVEMVDRDGIPLGMLPRPLVHTFNLLHRGIGLVVAKDASIHSQSTEFPALYVHRRTDDKRIFPSLYDMFVGGVSSAGEDATTTAAREVAEELGLTRALTDPTALSDPLFDCTVCTAYNRCVVTVFCFQFDSSLDIISWQEEEVAWGSFVPYSVVESSSQLCVRRMLSSGSWPGEVPRAIRLENQHSSSVGDHYKGEEDWTTWDYVPDGLLVWEAWLRWHNNQDFS